MRETANNQGDNTLAANAEEGVNARVFRTMAVAIALAIVASLVFAPWRVTTGLLLGGFLSLLNHHWMRTSVAAAFESALGSGATPRITIAHYFLRYFVVGLTVFAAYQLNIVSLPATIAGLCSFVVALFAEAFREFYFVIIHREETS
ncbi:MAG: ATP synthase subunit I [Acidobacteriota bacterium]